MVFGTAMSLVTCLMLLDSLGAEFPRTTRSARKHYCGKSLASALSIICDGWYKRSSPFVPTYDSDLESESEDPWEQGEFQYLYQPFWNKQNALTMLRSAEQKRGSRAKGVVDECCRQSCTLDELHQYCGAKRDQQ